MQRFAALTGNAGDEEKYRQLEQKLKKIIKEKFWDNTVTGEINKQTLFASLLYFDVLPAEDIPAASDSLLNAVAQAPSGHFTTGIFGTKYILGALSEYVSPEKVFEIVNSKDYPGWGFMIGKGATTIWEIWKESDNIYSNCHPMFGSVSEWFFHWLGGIRPDINHPGFEKFALSPFVPANLDSMECRYQSPYGDIVSKWKKENDRIVYQFEIPKGATASVCLGKAGKGISIRKDGDIGFSPAQVKGIQTGRFELFEGRYRIIID